MDRTVIITGGTGGIGLATAKLLLYRDRAVHVALVDRANSPANDLMTELDSARFQVFACDVTSAESVGEAYAAITASLPDVHGLVNGAGIVHNAASQDLTLEDLHRMLAVHVDGTLLWSQAVAPKMASGGGGAIVNIGSIAGLFGHPRRLAYAAAKASIHSITKTLAVEWAPDNIRVNAVTPGYIATPMMVEVARIGLVDNEVAASWTAMKRLGTPEEVAEAITFLLSNHSSYITGVSLPVDGGFSVLKAE